MALEHGHLTGSSSTYNPPRQPRHLSLSLSTILPFSLHQNLPLAIRRLSKKTSRHSDFCSLSIPVDLHHPFRATSSLTDLVLEVHGWTEMHPKQQRMKRLDRLQRTKTAQSGQSSSDIRFSPASFLILQVFPLPPSPITPNWATCVVTDSFLGSSSLLLVPFL